MTCIKVGSDESHFNVSLIVRDSHKTVSTNHNFWRERRTETVSNRGPSALQPTARPNRLSGRKRLFFMVMNKCKFQVNLHVAHTFLVCTNFMGCMEPQTVLFLSQHLRGLVKLLFLSQRWHKTYKTSQMLGTRVCDIYFLLFACRACRWHLHYLLHCITTGACDMVSVKFVPKY